MTISVDDLVRRQEAILAEIESLDGEQLNALANLPQSRGAISKMDSMARKLLRGLVRIQTVGTVAASNRVDSPDKPAIIPALPGFFLVDLLPLPDDSFHREHVIKTPVVAWIIDGTSCRPMPIVPGSPVADRWAVLTPEDCVTTDELTELFGEGPLRPKDWIRSEIEWVEAQERPELQLASIIRH